MRASEPMDPHAERQWWLRAETGLLAVAFVVCVAAIRQDLPWGVNVDEPGWVPVAVRMASSGDLSPHWFGHPGSTVLYPLALISHLWHVWTQGGRLLGADPALWTHFQEAPAEYYVLGRLLAIAYLLLAMWLTIRIGRHLGGRALGLVAAAVLPALGLGAAATLWFAWRVVDERWGRRPWSWALASVALFTVLVVAARPTAARLGQLRHPGSRAAATRWLAMELRPGERVLTEDFGPYAFGEDMRSGYGPAHWDHWQSFAGGEAKRLPQLGAAAAEGRLDTSDEGYVVLSSFVYGPVLAEPRRFPGETDFYRRALDCVPAASFSSREGPELRILRGGDLAACLDRSVAAERTPSAVPGDGWTCASSAERR